LQEPVIKSYTDNELDKFKFLRLVVKTSGLDNPIESQLIDYSESCSKCKAGRQFVNPLKVSKNSMLKKRIDMNFRYGYLIVDKELAHEIKEAKFNGIEFKEAELGKDKTNFMNALITAELPRMSERSIILKSQVCEICGRSGHYSNYDKADEIWYDSSVLKKATHDFYKTWEYFGIWDKGQTFQSIIISQRVRQFLKSLKLRHIGYEPIFENK